MSDVIMISLSVYISTDKSMLCCNFYSITVVVVLLFLLFQGTNGVYCLAMLCFIPCFKSLN